MPIIEFYSPDSHKVYTFYARNLEQTAWIPKCPDHPDYRMERMVSRFSVTSRREEAEGENPAADDPGMLAAMGELEREMGRIDEDNPDPRQLGHLMRKMAEVSGEPMTGQMEEMVRKLEEGADPEQLEEEFGDVLDDEMPEMEGGSDESVAVGDRLLRRMRRRKAPERDPQLYEFDERSINR